MVISQSRTIDQLSSAFFQNEELVNFLQVFFLKLHKAFNTNVPVLSELQ